MKSIAAISGMQCQHCVRAVFTALSGVPGIISADVSLGRAIVEHDGSVTADGIRQAISIAGYSVSAVTHDHRSLPLVV